MLAEGTRVCAYWSERSRCLYPGYVRRGEASVTENCICISSAFITADRVNFYHLQVVHLMRGSKAG